MNPEGGSSVPNFSTFAPRCYLQDLRETVVVVVGRLDLKRNSPLLSKDGKGGQKGPLLQ